MRYKEYKKADIPWLNEVPSHWEVGRLKRIAEDFYSGGTPSAGSDEYYTDNGNNYFLNISDMSSSIFVSSIKKRLTERGIKAKQLQIQPRGNIVYAMYASVGKVALLNLDCYISQAFLSFRTTNDSFKKYILYQLLSMEDNMNFYTRTSTQKNLNAELVKNMVVLLPPKEEQEQIARFLDWKISEIDRLMEVKKGKIKNNNYLWENILQKKLLNNKKNIKLKFICDVIAGKEVNDEISFNSNAIPVYGSSKDSFKYTSESLLDGDYVIVGRKGTIGKPYKLKGKFWIVDTAYAIKNKKNTDLDFLYYSLSAMNWEKYTTKTALPSIVADEVLEEKIYCPSLETQKKIVKKLNSIRQMIDKVNFTLETQIEDLKLLKKSLISDVVTGKLDIRNIDVPPYIKSNEVELDNNLTSLS